MRDATTEALADLFDLQVAVCYSRPQLTHEFSRIREALSTEMNRLKGIEVQYDLLLAKNERLEARVSELEGAR